MTFYLICAILPVKNKGDKMEKKFIKTGNSYALVIPPSILEMLGVNPQKDKVKLTLEGKAIKIVPVK